jgi:hypothetical protein
LVIKIGSDDLVGHTVQFLEAVKLEKGDQALITGAKGLALMALRHLTEPGLLDEIKEEFKNRKDRESK